ncbi:hypothetical protein DEO72_LG8g2298 [Vigna unguiculata]|uniref:Uncharacterized protein n=1 Tax=Vigna unguiculata TaxID=3917 RepID=A0A4D6MU41_VIGUN|nr:hypothetical protein DEO72_LG8g2298 [Vigna unguiculata]
MHPRPYGTASSSRVPARGALESPTNPLLGSPNPDTEIPVFCPQKHNRVSCNKLLVIHKSTPSSCQQMPPRRAPVDVCEFPCFPVNILGEDVLNRRISRVI